VSSANLTGKAMERNMELGVIVRGGSVPARIASQFDRLIATDVLVPRI
jgi:phosphatidylserine/phosphatidylglycerophosphate/cardiolipin synthase-like enzyme